MPDSGLIVITGVNGSGKTSILKYISETNGEKVLFNTTHEIKKVRSTRLSRQRMLSGWLYDNDKDYEPMTFDKIMDNIATECIRYFRRKNLNRRFNLSESLDVLFNEKNHLHRDHYYALSTVVIEAISESTEMDIAISKDTLSDQFGIPTDIKRENAYIKAINAAIKKNQPEKFVDKEKKHVKQGKTVLAKYKATSLSESSQDEVKKIKETVDKDLNKNCKENAKLKNYDNFIGYIKKLDDQSLLNINSIISNISTRIYQNAKALKGRAKKKLWEEINEDIDQYNTVVKQTFSDLGDDYETLYEKKEELDHKLNGITQDQKNKVLPILQQTTFPYKLKEPILHSDSYSLEFAKLGMPTPLPFESLSTGEKKIFELICYVFAVKQFKKDLKLELIILDEFDANLNPALSKKYLTIIRTGFCENSIAVMLTTHSPSTVCEIEAHELFEIDINQTPSSIQCATDIKNGKKEILKKLAPKLNYDAELNLLSCIHQINASVIVLVEGKNDLKNLKDLKPDTILIHPCDGTGNLQKMIALACKYKILFKNKLLIGLFDFDKAGVASAKSTLGSGNEKDESLIDKIKNKEKPYVKHNDFSEVNLYIYVATLQPSETKERWDYEKNPFKHESFKSDSEAIDRHRKLIEAIRQEVEAIKQEARKPVVTGAC
ncbi:AAA family ATPase [Candidatus Marinamargulisbacteria bacterium]|nr:AAA family ATPase [Candidatus Marinamargulisbacteria bacterium]